MSIGGQVTLINSVHNSILLYTFSFYKSPNIVIQEAPKIVILEISRFKEILFGGEGLTRNSVIFVGWLGTEYAFLRKMEG